MLSLGISSTAPLPLQHRAGTVARPLQGAYAQLLRIASRGQPRRALDCRRESRGFDGADTVCRRQLRCLRVEDMPSHPALSRGPARSSPVRSTEGLCTTTSSQRARCGSRLGRRVGLALCESQWTVWRWRGLELWELESRAVCSVYSQWGRWRWHRWRVLRWPDISLHMSMTSIYRDGQNTFMGPAETCESRTSLYLIRHPRRHIVLVHSESGSLDPRLHAAIAWIT